MCLDDIKKEIISNLRKYHSGKWVSPVIATRDLLPESFTAIEELVEANILERKYIYHNGFNAAMVRYIDHSWATRASLTVIDGDKQ